MDLNIWSFVLSVMGLLLGFISAFAPLRTFSLRALKAGNESAERWMHRIEAQSDFYIEYPSALIAYIARSAILLIAIFGVAVLFLRTTSAVPLPIPEWGTVSLRFLVAMLFSNTMTGATMTVRQVLRRSKQRYAEKSSNG